MVASALVRRVNAAGGSAMVLAKGDASAGSFLIVTLERGAGVRLWERGYDQAGAAALVPTGPVDADESAVGAYWQRRRERDPDLWVVELDIAGAERFAAETILGR